MTNYRLKKLQAIAHNKVYEEALKRYGEANPYTLKLARKRMRQAEGEALRRAKLKGLQNDSLSL